MNSTATQIANLISTPNPSASIITHALAELGNSSMQNGLRRIVSYFAAESASNLRLGRIQGGLVGVLGTAAVGGIALIYHFTQKKQLETEGKVILNTLQKPAPEKSTIIEETVLTDITVDQDTDDNIPTKE